METGFDIPVALFMFKRSETLMRIIDVIRKVKPKKMYLIGDGPRNKDEVEMVDRARAIVEQAIDWPCTIVKNYAEKNRGVYENIAGGAKWVLKRERWAIFLEDDNLPEQTFFAFCEEMLKKYECNEKVLWICGTNYLENYSPPNGASYVFTRHLLPCGWASWSGKFEKNYDDHFAVFEKRNFKKSLMKNYTSKALCKQQILSAKSEVYRRRKGMRYASWDFQMALTIREHGLYGICPCTNQIKNIGVDALSTHGGSSFANEMTQRFCGIESVPLSFPLIHPEGVVCDEAFEKKVDAIILFPLKLRIKDGIAAVIKACMGISRFEKMNLKNSKWWRGNE